MHSSKYKPHTISIKFGGHEQWALILKELRTPGWRVVSGLDGGSALTSVCQGPFTSVKGKTKESSSFARALASLLD